MPATPARMPHEGIRNRVNREVCFCAEDCHGESIIPAEIQSTSSEKCWEIVIEPFDDGWPEYEESFTMVQ